MPSLLTFEMTGPGKGKVNVSKDAPVPMLAFGMCTLIEWAIGCGVHRFCLKKWCHPGGVEVSLHPLDVEAKPLQAAGCTLLGDLHNWGLLPADISVMERMGLDGQSAVVSDGQSRVSFNKNGTLVQTHDAKMDIALSTWAFGHADYIAGFFWRGVTEVKVYFSVKLTQIHVTPALDRIQINEVMSDGANYPENALVAGLQKPSDRNSTPRAKS